MSLQAKQAARFASRMRRAGIEEIAFDGSGNVSRIRLSLYAPETPDPIPTFDPDPAVNSVHVAAYRKKRELEHRAAEQAAADAVRFAATEGVSE